MNFADPDQFHFRLPDPDLLGKSELNKYKLKSYIRIVNNKMSDPVPDGKLYNHNSQH